MCFFLYLNIACSSGVKDFLQPLHYIKQNQTLLISLGGYFSVKYGLQVTHEYRKIKCFIYILINN